jgi:hypothetical protein
VFTSTSNADHAQAAAAEVLIPAIRAGATISLAVAPCSLGFVIIAVSEQLIRSIMVGDDPVMLVSDLQNQFPNNAIEVDEDHDPGLVARVVELLEYLDQALGLPLDSTCIKSFLRLMDGRSKPLNAIASVNAEYLSGDSGGLL